MSKSQKHAHFNSWTAYAGPLTEATDPADVGGMVTRILGFRSGDEPESATLPGDGTSYGFVADGKVKLGADGAVTLGAGCWFSLPGAEALVLEPGSRVFVCQRLGFVGLRAFGGPIEPAGRLRYIDGCSDTVLAGPPRQGDPCLNHLHFPPRTDQTAHTHPSTRAGVVVRGEGWCDTPDGRSPLRPGVVFHIPAGGEHRFITEGESMDVVAYHPDSDWGPTDEDHPMLNRTWVDGAKLDNTAGIHAKSPRVREDGQVR